MAESRNIIVKHGFFNNKEVLLKDVTIDIFEAARTGELEIIAQLITAGCNINATNNRGEFPLYLAIKNNQVATVKYLISRGAALDRIYSGNFSSEQTILHVAVQGGNDEIVEILLQAGMCADEINKCHIKKNAVTPLYLATRHLAICSKTVALLTSNGYAETAHNKFANIVQLLISYGANVNQYTTDRKPQTKECTLLKYWLDSSVSEEPAKLLVRYGATDYTGLTQENLKTLEKIQKEIVNEIKSELVAKTQNLRRDPSSFFSLLPRDVIDYLIVPMINDPSFRCLKKSVQ